MICVPASSPDHSLPRTLAQLRREIVTAGLVIAAIMVGALSPMGRPVVSEVSAPAAASHSELKKTEAPLALGQ
jgi:hypothetical protein